MPRAPVPLIGALGVRILGQTSGRLLGSHDESQICTLGRRTSDYRFPARSGILCANIHPGHHRRMSPTVFRERGYRFYFFSREERRRHVHVMSARGEAKYCLEPQLELAKNYQLSRTELREIEQIIEAHLDELTTA